MSARIMVVTGTSTDVGKTVAVAALASAAMAAGRSVAVYKPAQTGVGPGEPGDFDEVRRLAGEVAGGEGLRYPEPLAPETAARRAGMEYLRLEAVGDDVAALAAQHDLVIVEGAGGVMVRLAPDLTIADVAVALDAEVLVVTDPGLGTLNHTELTVEALAARGARTTGLIVGSWPHEPDLAMRCNVDDLPRLTGVPIVATVPAGAASMNPHDFRAAAPTWVADGLLNAGVGVDGFDRAAGPQIKEHVK